MAERYFYTHGAAQHGPFSALQMRQFAAAGDIFPTDTVWKEGAVERILASQIKNLYSAPGPAPMPVVAVPLPAATAVALCDVADPPAAAEASGADTTVAAPAVAKKIEAPSRAKRVTAIRGGILCNQDGVTVRFRKKCIKCGHEDQARCSAPIRTGSMRIPFYCPKCRKSRSVEMTAVG